MNILSAMVFGMMVTGVAVAQTGGEVALFDDLDVDKDSQITVFEAEANMDVLEQFNQLDNDGDGRLTRVEFAEFAKRE